jgi:nucleotide-binding universal stress UspA family protein
MKSYLDMWRTMSGTILIASDGGKESEGALRLGLSLSQESHCEIEVIGVLQPVPRYGVGSLAPFPEAYVDYEAQQAEALKRALTDQLREIGEAAAEWPVTVEFGTPAAAIANHARRRNAKMIILGMGQHAPLDRWLGDETALKVIRMATVPVLAAARETASRPRRALIAVDFSDHSIRAATAALEVLAEDAHLYLAHVMWPATEIAPFPGLKEWRRTYERGAEQQLEQLSEQIRASHGVTVDFTILHGDPAEELVGLGSRLNVDLVVAGSHGHGFLGRIMMGSVSTRLLRAARSSVFIVPPEVPPKDLEGTASAHPDSSMVGRGDSADVGVVERIAPT